MVRLDISDDDGVAEVTLTRPERRNALDEAAFRALGECAATVAGAVADGRVRAVLLRGEGPAFCSGVDTTLFAGQVEEPPADAWIARLQQAFTAWEDCLVPTVAAVHGATFGAGLQLALAAHLRVAAPDARLALLETRWGLVPDLGATYRLPRLVGLGRAVELAVSAREIDAGEAERIGLVNAVLDAGDFAGAARAWVARLAAQPPVATGAVPRLMRQGLLATRDQALAAERAAQLACLGSDDFREAVRSALAGEAPDLRGR